MSNFETAFFVYFVYGLTFFSMGLILLLESWRMDPEQPQKKLIVPLSIFGLLHGAHEWLEIFIFQTQQLNESLPGFVVWLRLGLLVGSFIALWFYSIRTYRYAHGFKTQLALIGAATLPVFALLAASDVIFAYLAGSIPFLRFAESLARYLLGVIGAAVATIGLHFSALKARADGRTPLDQYLKVTAIGFALYSLTQLFVPNMNTILARYFNTDIFQTLTAIPIQVIRTAVAIVITTGLVLATRFLEIERQQFVTAAQKIRLEALEQKEEMRRDLLRHVVRAQEEERARIARELHDEMAQTLTAFSLDLATLQQLLGPRAKSLPIITHLQELGRRMSQDMQRMVHDLRPAHLDDLGLVPALKFMIDYDGSRLKLKVDFRIDGEIRRLDPLVETVIYRITQESLTNVARHAGTNAVCVCLDFLPREIRLRVIDSGLGFDPEQAVPIPHGWGLVGMKERAESVGGVLRVESEIGRGTTIRVEIPVNLIEGKS